MVYTLEDCDFTVNAPRRLVLNCEYCMNMMETSTTIEEYKQARAVLYNNLNAFEKIILKRIKEPKQPNRS